MFLKTLLWGLGLIFLFLLFRLYNKEELPPIPKTSTLITETLSKQEISLKTLKKAEKESKFLVKEKSIKKSIEKIENVELYESISLEEALLSHSPRSYVQAISAIRMKTSTLHQGDTLVLPNIEGRDYEILISHVQDNEDTSQSITGAYSDEGISYSTTMTTSTHESFIALATTEGSYEMEIRKDIGYIYKTQDIRKIMQPFPVNDEIILSFSPISKDLD